MEFRSLRGQISWFLKICLFVVGITSAIRLAGQVAAAAPGNIFVYLPLQAKDASKISPPTPTPPPTGQTIPYGPLHNSNYNRTFFNGAAISEGEWRDLPTIRAKGYRVTAAAAIENPCSHVINGIFSVDEFLGEIIAHRDEILDYASDGTLIGLLELNEPQYPSSCDPIPVSLLAEAAERFWEAFPELSMDTFYFGYDTPATYLEDGGGAPYVNMTFGQFSTGKGQIEDFFGPLQESASRQGMKMVYSANLDQLGVENTVAANIWECGQPDALLVSIYYDELVNDVDANLYSAALAACNGN